MDDGIFTPKDLALRAVGRTVVNFQRLEHNLKVLARLGPVEGVLAKVRRDIEKRAEKASSFTLGQAIQAWMGALPRSLHLLAPPGGRYFTSQVSQAPPGVVLLLLVSSWGFRRVSFVFALGGVPRARK